MAYLQGLQYSKVYDEVQMSHVDRDLAYLQVLQYSKVYGAGTNVFGFNSLSKKIIGHFLATFKLNLNFFFKDNSILCSVILYYKKCKIFINLLIGNIYI